MRGRERKVSARSDERRKIETNEGDVQDVDSRGYDCSVSSMEEYA